MPEPFYPGVGSLIKTDVWCGHYTSLETALEYILPSNTVRFSPLYAVNDPKESGVEGWMGGGTPVPPELLQQYIAHEERVDRHLRRHVKVLCACVDHNENPMGLDRAHFKPRMWAQYGKSGRGVCLVFDRRLLAALTPEDCAETRRTSEVTYTDDAHQMAIPDLAAEDLDRSPIELARERYLRHFDRIAFTKHRDWQSESEIRFAFYTDRPGPEALNFREALGAIIVGPNFPIPYKPLIQAAAEARQIPALQLRWNATSTNHERWA